MTLLEKQAKLDKLTAARFSGVRSITFQDQKLEYNSYADLAAAIRDLEREIAADQSQPQTRSSFISHSRG